MKFHKILSHSRWLSRIGLALIASCGYGCTDDSVAVSQDFTVIGREVIVTIPVIFPEMEVRSRANMDANDLNKVESLWVATFNSNTGDMTSNGWQNKTAEPNTGDTHVLRNISIKSKSGPSYIVAVANVESLKGVTPDNLAPRPLGELLTDGMTWSDFLKIGVVSPSTQDLVNSPNPPLAMAGAYTNISANGPHTPQTSPSGWQTENFTSYTIPSSESGIVTLTGGAIHMRRLVSQVTFNLIPGKTTIAGTATSINMKITPHNYRVINVPKFSWLYERAGEETTSVKNYGANFGDACAESTKGNYYWSTGEYASNNIPEQADGSFSFNFWQGENKHSSLQGQAVADYDGRDKEGTAALPGVDQDTDQNIQTGKGTGLFTALTGGTWTSNNMATYVLISCSVDYESPINVNDQGVLADSGTKVTRTGDATFLVHLGYMNAAVTDFSCFRNTQYTYNLTINGINDIRVEAFHGSETPGVSGMVADIETSYRSLDCHYNVYNIQLDAGELTKYDHTNNSGFGFLMTTYDSGDEHTYTEADFVGEGKGFANLSDAEKQYLDWIELKPTTGENVLAAYTPRGAPNSTTFNLVDASRGELQANQKSANGWYTLFVREYTYEAKDADESVYVNGKPIWHRYAFANPRRFYIRTTKAVSSDGESLYTRAKYAGVQSSISSYYDQKAVPTSTQSGKVAGSAIGVESVNESYGLNLCNSAHGSSADNGRYNCWSVFGDKKWSDSLIVDRNQTINANTTNKIKAATWAIPQIKPFYDKVPEKLTGKDNYPQSNSNNINDYIGAINACLNRNRDNNGNGVIDKSEMRWYIPAMGKYLRMILGQDALEPNTLVDYATMPNRPVSANEYWGQYFFYGSEGRVLWAMEGFSTSDYFQYVKVNPWQVRCIRNLGTN